MVATPTNAAAQLEKGIKTSRGFNLLQAAMKRSGPHEQFIREYRLEPGGITVGPPILRFQGVLTGVPTLVGAIDLVMPAHGPSAR
jgi:hypothetical protein